ncbi:hypothetical protein LCGC14_1156060 [marine sediment metagenome]|uniref:Uncharacterized protein n=1 Tax=marine sediment metagenome TaxID=412755 RepID=A0A0F9LYX1_9ZZZZ
MSGDYVPIETDLPTQRKVIAMAGRMGVSPFEVAGRLAYFWGWFTQQNVVILNGDRGALVGAYVDTVVDAGMAPRALLDAMIEQEWLTKETVDGQPALVVPRYSSWLEKCAKARRQKTIRQRKWRQGMAAAPEKKTKDSDCRRLRRRLSVDAPVDAPVDASIEMRDESKKKPLVVPLELLPWLQWWNRMHTEGLVSAGVDENKPSQAVAGSWKKSQADAEVRDLLADRDQIEQRIRASQFCREGWFRLEKLFGRRNKDKELILRVLVEGGYQDGPKTKSPTSGAYDDRRPAKPGQADF